MTMRGPIAISSEEGALVTYIRGSRRNSRLLL